MNETKEVEDSILILENLKNGLSEIVFEVVDKNDKKLTDLVRSQLSTGTEGTGKPIKPPYTPFTVKIKKAKAQEHRFVTLRDTGDFWASIDVEFDRSNESIQVIATDPKTNKLILKYGPNILEVSPENLRVFLKMVFTDIEQQFKKALL